jgi:SAM-dependent methyltransferase
MCGEARMHPECEEWVRDAVGRHVGRPGRVIELGGRNVNGSNRVHFPPAWFEYVSVDRLDGPEVDVIADAAEWRPETPGTVVVCTNVLEHEARWRELVKTAYDSLAPDGVFIVTTVTDPFPPHSGIDGFGVRDGEYYRGVPLDELLDALRSAGFAVTDYRTTRQGDVQAVAVRPNTITLPPLSQTTGLPVG